MWKLLYRLFQSKPPEDAKMFYIWNQSFMLDQDYNDSNDSNDNNDDMT